jgi:tetratricopeptide (TPR) repeat protein
MREGRVGRERIADLEAAVAQWERQAGADHPATLDARMRLALAYRERGRDEAALAELEQVAALCDEALGPGHPAALAARHELALSYFQMSIGSDNPAWLQDAVATMERAADSRLSTLGPAHPDTLASWDSLALLYSRAEQPGDRGRNLPKRVAAGWEQVVAEQERRLGPDEPGTQFGRMRLALAYNSLGRMDDERAIYEKIIESWGRLADARSRRLGPMHPDTVDACEHHAWCHRLVGRGNDEVALVEQIAADHERLLGPGDPRTLRALARLVFRYGEGGHDMSAAISVGERIISDAHDALGPEDEDVRAMWRMLFMCYMQTGRTSDARALQARFPAPDEGE